MDIFQMIGHGLGYQGTVGAILVIIGIGCAFIGSYISMALVVLAGILVIIVGLYNLRLVATRILNDLDNRGL